VVYRERHQPHSRRCHISGASGRGTNRPAALMATTPASIAVNRCAPPEASTLLHERTRAPRATVLVYSTQPQPQPQPQAQQHRRHFRVATVLVVSANSAPYRTPIVSPALARAYSLSRVPTRIRSAPHCNIKRVSVAKRLRCLSFLVSRAAVLSLLRARFLVAAVPRPPLAT